MIDDTNYADCLALYNFDHVEKHSIQGMMLPISMSTALMTLQRNSSRRS